MSDNRGEVLSGLESIKSGSLTLDFDPRYAESLRGKRVAVVGPAETMIGTGQGGLIDSYDLVVRFNTVIEYLPFSPELSRDIGSRTDILYSNNEVLIEGLVGQKLISHEKWPEVCERTGIKFVVATNNDFTYAPFSAPPRWYVEYLKLDRFLDELGGETGFRMLFAVTDTVRRLLKGYVGRTGFIAIFDLLLYDISELYVTGMTFYHKGGHLFLKDRAPELHPMKNHRAESPKD
ncbi:MAG TPA: glycosyltransferase family 29 protein, partial [Blastocatellia bacterium]|nr:glycosyltransferase family 29 protein [Blastocatellia bacterium]